MAVFLHVVYRFCFTKKVSPSIDRVLKQVDHQLMAVISSNLNRYQNFCRL